jgi:hypothetical protein
VPVQPVLPRGRFLRRVALCLVILAAEFAVLEAGLRIHGGTDASPAFQSLFMQDPAVGHRLKPNAQARYTTAEFSTDLAINAQGVRDDGPIGPKADDERRVVVLGDSLVLSVQVPLVETFCKRLEARLNATGDGRRWRVINAGVQGYGPVQEWFFFDRVAAALQPDIVLIVAFVGNDAIEANDTERWLEAGQPVQADAPVVGGLRRVARSSIVLQLLKMRWDQFRARFTTDAPERPLATYLGDPPPEVANGLDVSRRAFERIAVRAREAGARPAIVLMPARFQTDDADYGRLAEIVRRSGGELVRQSGTARFLAALAPLQVPMLDLQPALERQPDRVTLFFERNIHLTPRGHDVVGGALFEFLETSGLAAAAR